MNWKKIKNTQNNLVPTDKNTKKNIKIKQFHILKIPFIWYLIDNILTVSALIQNELYLIAKHIKKNEVEKTLRMCSEVHFINNVVNCKKYFTELAALSKW